MATYYFFTPSIWSTNRLPFPYCHVIIAGLTQHGFYSMASHCLQLIPNLSSIGTCGQASDAHRPHLRGCVILGKGLRGLDLPRIRIDYLPVIFQLAASGIRSLSLTFKRRCCSPALVVPALLAGLEWLTIKPIPLKNRGVARLGGLVILSKRLP